MKLSEAISKQADIICSNEEEKATVIDILHLNGVKMEGSYPLDTLNIGLVNGELYVIGSAVELDAKFITWPAIPASDFITSNTPQDSTTNTNEPAPHSSNIV